MPVAPPALSGLKIALGPDPSGRFDLGVPVLAGEAVETLFGSAQPVGHEGALALFRAEGWLLGAATVPIAAALEDATYRLYENILAATSAHHLARIWNYVPTINQPGPTGLENYRAFCRGRSHAFEQHHGPTFKALLPAASAVGRTAGALTVVVAASLERPRHAENPLQISAYDYPDEYGPRAPSFARATVVPGAASATVFVSGTAAIRGHQTVAPHQLAPQLACTLENLREVSQTCGLGSDLDRGAHSSRHFKIYLRHAADQPAVARMLEKEFLTRSDHVAYVQADICRAPLVIEIEASLFGVTTLRA